MRIFRKKPSSKNRLFRINFIKFHCRPRNQFLSVSSCPSSHKYAYLDGKYCCRTNKEKTGRRKLKDLCDESEIGIDSRCCENNDYAKCVYEKCINHQDAITNEQGNTT